MLPLKRYKTWTAVSENCSTFYW